MARSETGSWRPDLDKARTFTERGAQTFLDADIDAYMNPFIKGALDPTAREIREETERQRVRIGQDAAMVGAFGGDRQAILESENARGGTEALSDLYGRGYASAFESGANRWAADRDAAARAAEQYRATAAQNQQQVAQDMQNLLTTGGLKRQLEQAGLDFDYQQFVEARDWDITNLQPLLATLSSVPYSTTTTSKAKTRDPVGAVMGLASTGAGIFMMGKNSPGGWGGSNETGPAPPAGGAKTTMPVSGPGGTFPNESFMPTGSYQPTFFGSAYAPAAEVGTTWSTQNNFIPTFGTFQ